MLALSRKKGESIVLNNDIEVTVLDISTYLQKRSVSANSGC